MLGAAVQRPLHGFEPALGVFLVETLQHLVPGTDRRSRPLRRSSRRAAGDALANPQSLETPADRQHQLWFHHSLTHATTLHPARQGPTLQIGAVGPRHPDTLAPRAPGIHCSNRITEPICRRRAGRASLLKHALQEFDFLAEIGIILDHLLDLAHRVQHRGVIATAEAPADLRQ